MDLLWSKERPPPSPIQVRSLICVEGLKFSGTNTSQENPLRRLTCSGNQEKSRPWKLGYFLSEQESLLKAASAGLNPLDIGGNQPGPLENRGRRWSSALHPGTAESWPIVSEGHVAHFLTQLNSSTNRRTEHLQVGRLEDSWIRHWRLASFLPCCSVKKLSYERLRAAGRRLGVVRVGCAVLYPQFLAVWEIPQRCLGAWAVLPGWALEVGVIEASDLDTRVVSPPGCSP